jgi:hypothetical protein
MKSMETVHTLAKRVTGYAELPEPYLSMYKSHTHNNGESLPYTLFINGSASMNSAVIYLIDEALYILKNEKVFRFPIPEMNYMVESSILLRSSMKVSGACEGAVTTMEVEYNTLSENSFKPLLKELRKAIAGEGYSSEFKESPTFKFPENMSYKFVKYIKSGFLKGRILSLVVQELRSDGANDSVNNFVVILTDQELAIISEPTVGTIRKYALVVTYIPISKIDTLTVTPCSGERRFDELTIDMKHNDKLTFHIEKPNVKRIRKLIEQFERR